MTNLVEAAGGLLIQDYKILLIQRQTPDIERTFPLHWICPAGKRKLGEPLEKTSEREVKEEVSLDFFVKSLLGIYPYQDEIINVNSYAYLGNFSGIIIPNQKEVRDYGHFTYSKGRNLPLAFGFERVLDDLYSKGFIR